MIPIEFYLLELQKLLPDYDSCQILQQKDGITVARIHASGKSLIFKAFEKAEHRREISNYALLNSLAIPTPRILAATDGALLMEDLQESRFWRLGVAADMADPRTAAKLAQWYRLLHDNGADYAAAHGQHLYDESDFFTAENLQSVLQKSGAGDSPACRLLLSRFRDLRAAVDSVPRTLCYNDFNYTNFAVARDGSAAMMFDYNLLGKGFRYCDVRNACYDLSDAAESAFLAEYGPTDPLEQLIDEITSPVIALHIAYQRSAFPAWAQPSLKTLTTSEYADKIRRLLNG